MKENRWFVLGCLAFALVLYGVFVFINKRPVAHSRSPITVAAVRGGNGNVELPGTSAANAAVDYANALHSDVALAQKNADKLSAANEAHLAEAKKALE